MTELEASVLDALRAEASQEDGPHVDAVDLAEYLDGALPGAERDRVEAHLAACARCRLVAAEAGALIASAPAPRPVPARAVRPRGWPTRWLAAAAVGAVLLGAAWFLRAGQRAGQLALVGVAPEVVSGLDEALLGRAVRALAGRWPESSGFGAFGATVDRAGLRSGEIDGDPVPLEPRWFAVDTDRPVFRWRWGGVPADRFEILVVDADERPVAFLEIKASSFAEDLESPQLRTLRLPDDQPALSRGATYAWKVNVGVAGEWLASEYVPFRVLSSDESKQIAAQLSVDGSTPFLRSVILAGAGLDEQALLALYQVPANDGAIDAAVEGLIARRRLPHDAFQQELDRLGSR